ncbi:DMT family transporter [Blastococcus deserti]|uniref:DMT family transporter n=1 Tax=Blastococcus deserti TaxID=2259033 RepID=A0ABW4XDP7_9ACTN
MLTRRAATGHPVASGTGHPAPRRGDALALTIAVLCTSTAGPLIAATAAPALAIAFWRNGLAAAVLLVPALFRCRRELRGMSVGVLGGSLLAGTFLAAHFATFTPSLRFTSVASAAALVCSSAVWAAIFSRFLGERLSLRAWIGVAVALCGVLLLTGLDLSVTPRALLGDLLALLGGMFGGAYVVAGGRCRQHLSTTAYTLLCYGSAAGILLLVCVLMGQPLTGYAPADWVRIIALAVFAQLLGHSLFNLALRSTSATVVSLVTLFTVPLAAIIAAVALGQLPPVTTLPALVLLLAGVGLVVTARSTTVPAEHRWSRTVPVVLPEAPKSLDEEPAHGGDRSRSSGRTQDDE